MSEPVATCPSFPVGLLVLEGSVPCWAVVGGVVGVVSGGLLASRAWSVAFIWLMVLLMLSTCVDKRVTLPVSWVIFCVVSV